MVKTEAQVPEPESEPALVPVTPDAFHHAAQRYDDRRAKAGPRPKVTAKDGAVELRHPDKQLASLALLESIGSTDPWGCRQMGARPDEEISDGYGGLRI